MYSALSAAAAAPVFAVPWWSMLPFVVMLLSIAILPLIPVTAKLWHHTSFQVALSLVLGTPVVIWFIVAGQHLKVAETVHEYFQFIVLLFALFVVSGGIYLRGDIKATPKHNTIALAIGAAIASFVGTTGAAMLTIRPLLNMNRERRYKVHTVLFCIYLAANCGGMLTPLGDPPLFLGFLRGVPFTWTFRLVPEWLTVNGLLLLTYWALDRRYYLREPGWALRRDEREQEPFGIDGKLNFLWFAVIIAAVALAPTIDIEAIEHGHAIWHSYLPIREIVMLLAAAASFFSGSKRTRWVDNEFNWAPIAEVAALFIGIFATMMPALRFLEQIAPKLPLNVATFYGFTGGLSSFLDNAPTYATFFEMAKQLPGDSQVAGVPEIYLMAISLGSVFFGAMTYIGNGPNFMIKSVAEGRGVKMPSFGAYIGRSLLYLFPILVGMGMTFLDHHIYVRIAGVILLTLLALRAFYFIYQTRDKKLVTGDFPD